MNTNKLFGFNSNLYFLTGLFGGLAILLLVGIVTVYPAQNRFEEKRIDSTSWINNSENESMTTNFSAKASFAQRSQTDPIVGAWRYYSTISGFRCVTESVVQANGRYSSNTSCNNGVYFTHLTGNWRYLQSGLIRIEYDDRSGRDHPSGEMVYFSFINRNQIRLGNGIIANRIG